MSLSDPVSMPPSKPESFNLTLDTENERESFNLAKKVSTHEHKKINGKLIKSSSNPQVVFAKNSKLMSSLQVSST
jgi:hypothetical protein